VQTFLQTAAAMGVALILVTPLILQALGSTDQGQKIAAMGWFLAAVLVVGVPALLLSAGERVRPAAAPAAGGLGLKDAARLLATDRLVLRIMGSDFFVNLGQGFRGAVLVLFVSHYMGLPKWAYLLPFVQYGCGILASPLWARIGYRFGKSRTLIFAEAAQIVINLAQLALVPGQAGLLVTLAVAQGLTQGSGNLMLKAIVSDVADAQRLATGQERAGLLFSIFNITGSAAMGLAGGIALSLVGLLGFNAAQGAANAPEALNSLVYVVSFGPAFGHLLSALLMWNFPLTESRHEENIRRLEAAEGAAPATPEAAAAPDALAARGGAE
jgi:Na+/melibiose symporter-like transporter